MSYRRTSRKREEAVSKVSRLNTNHKAGAAETLSARGLSRERYSHFPMMVLSSNTLRRVAVKDCQNVLYN
jgi:hypothetical protein